MKRNKSYFSFSPHSLVKKNITKTALLNDSIHEDLAMGKISLWKAIGLYNQHYFFPTLITIYLVLLLIEQTSLRNLQASNIYLSINQNFILFLVIISGIGTSREDEVITKKYTMTTKSVGLFYLYIVLCVFLSILAIYIIYYQTIELGIIGVIISILSGILIGLVGMMLLEEE